MKHRHHDVDLDKWTEQMRAAVRAEFEDKGKFEPPRAYVLATRDPKTGLLLPRPAMIIMMPSQMGSNDEKQTFAEVVSAMARRSHALAYIFASEAWSASEKTEEDYRKVRAFARDHSLENWPGRGEEIILSYQHLATSKTIVWIGNITRDANGKPTLAEFVPREGGGRFTGLMPEVN